MLLKVIADDLRRLRGVIQRNSLLSSFHVFRELKLPALDATDLAQLKEQALELHSFLLVLGIEAYQVCQHDQIDDEQIAKLSQLCLLSGRFKDILDLQDHFQCNELSVLSISVLAAYRLSDWRRVLIAGNLLPDEEKTFLDSSMIVRSLLELDQFSEALSLLPTLAPLSTEEQRRKELLVLLSRFRAGIESSTDANQLLNSLDSFDQHEAACFLRYLSRASYYLHPTTARERLNDSAHLLASRIIRSKTYSGLHERLPSLRPQVNDRNQSIAFVYKRFTYHDLFQADALSLAITSADPQVTVTHVVLEPDDALSNLDRPDILFCHRLMSLELLSFLCEQSFDVLIDCIGIRDTSWLLTLSQRISPLQLLWSDAPVDYLSEYLSYDAQIVDRWTTPAEQQPGTLPCLTLTGTRRLLRHNNAVSRTESDKNCVSAITQSKLLVLGAPDQLIPFSGLLLQRLLRETPVQQLLMTSAAFRDGDFLASWWQFWNIQNVSNVNSCYCNLSHLDQGDDVRLIAIDLCIETPCDDALWCIEHGIPIVHLSSHCIGSMGAVSMLSSLGLESLTRSNPEELIEVVNILADYDNNMYQKISDAILSNLANSLLCDYPLFGSDLLEAIRVARRANTVLSS